MPDLPDVPGELVPTVPRESLVIMEILDKILTEIMNHPVGAVLAALFTGVSSLTVLWYFYNWYTNRKTAVTRIETKEAIESHITAMTAPLRDGPLSVVIEGQSEVTDEVIIQIIEALHSITAEQEALRNYGVQIGEILTQMSHQITVDSIIVDALTNENADQRELIEVIEMQITALAMDQESATDLDDVDRSGTELPDYGG